MLTKVPFYLLGAATEVETLKKALAEVEEKAAEEKASREKHEARVSEVQLELQDAFKKCESLERSLTDQESELTKARQNAHDARVEAQGALQEIQEARKIVAGKAFIMQSKYVKKRFLLLTRIWSSPGAFVDLPRSVSDAMEFFRAREGSSTEKLFWSIPCARISGAIERSTKTAGRTAQGGWTSHEGFNNPAMACRSHPEQLLRAREAAR